MIRTIGKLLRGKATPFQLFSACVLGAMLGFMPGFAQAPGLMVVLVLVLIILNANLALGAICAGLSKLLSLALAPVSFAIGHWLLDGPLTELFRWMINAPVLALFGFEYYTVTGGLLLGLLFGVAAGYGVAAGMTSYRRKMAALEKDSERFRQLNSKTWVKALKFVLIGGGKGKLSFEDLLAKRVGNPIRPLGAVFAALVVVLLVIVYLFASGPIVTSSLQAGLERVNGATVDLAGADLNLKENRLTLQGLALADPNALDTDLFRATKLEADISGANLLRKRLQLDRVVISEASTGEKRATPGHLIGKALEPVAAPKAPNTKTIDDYIKDAKVWKERLAQARRWLEKISGPGGEKTATPAEKKETLQERLEREVRELGYNRVKASQLVEGSPTFTVTELVADGVRTAELPGETLSITASNLSTQPMLLGKAPFVRVQSSKDTLSFQTQMGAFGTPAGSDTLDFAYRGLPTDKVAGSLVVNGSKPIQGGTIDLSANGTLNTIGGLTIDLPLQATLHNVTLNIAGQSNLVEKLVLPIGLSGPLDNPRVKVDEKLLADALVKAGVNRAVAEGKKKAEELINKEVGDKVGEQGKGLLKGLLDRSKK